MGNAAVKLERGVSEPTPRPPRLAVGSGGSRGGGGDDSGSIEGRRILFPNLPPAIIFPGKGHLPEPMVNLQQNFQ